MNNKILLIFLLAVMACSSVNKVNNNIQPPKEAEQVQQPKPIEMVNLSKGIASGDDQVVTGNLIIKTQEELKLYTVLVSEGFKQPVDFSKEIVIAVVDKVRNTGGYDVKINHVVNTPDVIEVYVERTSPKPFDMVTMAFSQPYHFIKIKRTDKKIVFK